MAWKRAHLVELPAFQIAFHVRPSLEDPLSGQRPRFYVYGFDLVKLARIFGVNADPSDILIL